MKFGGVLNPNKMFENSTEGRKFTYFLREIKKIYK